MPLLNSTNCDSCLTLREKVAELEARVSTLYQIKESERYLDQHSSKAHCRSPETSSPIDENEWPKLGARPKTETGKWTAPKQRKRGRNLSSINPPSLTLSNNFDPLRTITEDRISSPLAKRTRDVSGYATPLKRTPAIVNFTPARHPTSPSKSRLFSHHAETSQHGNLNKRYAESNSIIVAHREAYANTISTEPPSNIATQALRPRSDLIANDPTPSPNANEGNADTILIGDTMTRHVKLAKTENLCLSSTSVEELSSVLPRILNERQSEPKIVIHTGSFDILYKKTGSETLKEHYTQLLATLSTFQDVWISGPIACFRRRGIEAFSRLLSFNTWLASTCRVHNLRFIDNFNVFWNCADRFQSDGLHPNRRGSTLLSANINHALGATSSGQNRDLLTSTPKASRGTGQNENTDKA